MELDKKDFRKTFPRLAKELKGKKQTIPVTSIRSDILPGEKAASRKSNRYLPDVIDFIRRCDNEQQAEEIICYVEGRREISPDYAKRLRNQLKEKGLRSFGLKKEDDYYLKQGGC